MEYHIIHGTEVTTPAVPSPISGEQFNATWVQYTYPESQTKVRVDTDFIVKFRAPIDATELSLDNFEIHKVVDIDPLTVEVLPDPWEDFSLEWDYNYIGREVGLRLKSSLVAQTNYFLVVKNVKATTGDVQTDDHIILFQTAVDADRLEITGRPEIDTVILQDYTLAGPPTMVSTAVTCSILDGSINVSGNSFTLTFEDGTIDEDQIVVVKENLDTGATTVLDITAIKDSNVVTVTLPESTQTNCLYTVQAIYRTFQFIGAIDPFFVPLSDFIIYTSSANSDPITWARMVFIFSREVKALLGSSYSVVASERPEALRNYTKYMILNLFATESTNDSFMLGEFQVTAGLKQGINYPELLSMWQSELFDYPIGSADVMGPRSTGFYVPTGVRREHMERDFGVFDRRLMNNRRHRI
jgi:hypothetical protein